MPPSQRRVPPTFDTVSLTGRTKCTTSDYRSAVLRVLVRAGVFAKESRRYPKYPQNRSQGFLTVWNCLRMILNSKKQAHVAGKMAEEL